MDVVFELILNSYTREVLDDVATSTFDPVWSTSDIILWWDVCRVLRDRYQLRPRLRRVRYDIV